MYYPDLSLYEYGVPETVPDVRNVGWLDENHEFARGDVDPDVVSRLRWLAAERRVAQSRGYHYCPFCIAPTANSDELPRGSAEIWVPAIDWDGYFAAPALVVHYISDHAYAPPDSFVKAVARMELGDGVPDLDAASTAFIQSRLEPPPPKRHS